MCWDFSFYYVHNDHLGTPQVVTNQTKQVVWMADYQPFGKVNLVTNTVELYSRFPEQYVDGETGNYYNYFRDYDPSIGRYIESDPIGLEGGINTYAYVGNNPISFVDFFGLACSCMYNKNIAKDDAYDPTWYGQKRTVKAHYDCQNTDKKDSVEDVEGTHEETYMHRQSGDNGKEGNPLGTTYDPTPTYNSYSGTYTYNTQWIY